MLPAPAQSAKGPSESLHSVLVLVSVLISQPGRRRALPPAPVPVARVSSPVAPSHALCGPPSCLRPLNPGAPTGSVLGPLLLHTCPPGQRPQPWASAGNGPWPVRNHAAQQVVGLTVTCLTHLEPSPTHSPRFIPGPAIMVFHETGPWCQRGWGPLPEGLIQSPHCRSPPQAHPPTSAPRAGARRSSPGQASPHSRHDTVPSPETDRPSAPTAACPFAGHNQKVQTSTQDPTARAAAPLRSLAPRPDLQRLLSVSHAARPAPVYLQYRGHGSAAPSPSPAAAHPPPSLRGLPSPVVMTTAPGCPLTSALTPLPLLTLQQPHCPSAWNSDPQESHMTRPPCHISPRTPARPS